MMLFDHATFQSTPLAKVHIWRCQDGCGFHVRVGTVVITFAPEELAAFLRAAGGCYLGEDCAHMESFTTVAEFGAHPGTEAGSKAAIEPLTSMLEH